ncbi:MAG: hypothetical protein K0U93_15490 [Gammaproteobacteria bacterium]|nr:hypothetical protein [Gammaproteobacteria bacterium]
MSDYKKKRRRGVSVDEAQLAIALATTFNLWLLLKLEIYPGRKKAGETPLSYLH